MARMKPRVIAFVNGPLGDHAIRVLKPYLPGIISGDCTAAAIRRLRPTHGVSAGYRSILSQEVIDLFPAGIANIHTSLLPIGRGAYPNAFAIRWGQKAGVTMHLIDAGVDTGPILVQQEVPYDGHDTAKTLHEKLTAAAKVLITDHLVRWIEHPEEYSPRPQGYAPGATRKADLEMLQITADMKAHAVIDTLRARTFAPYAGARYVARDGTAYRVRVEMEPEA